VELDDFYKKIEAEKTPEERRTLEERLRNALVMLATGSTGGGPGMRSSRHNILYVPEPHAEYYNTGYNWIIIPIMTLDQIKDWSGEQYEVAIFVGEHDEEVKNAKNEE
jgi:hypothetical protein